MASAAFKKPKAFVPAAQAAPAASKKMDLGFSGASSLIRRLIAGLCARFVLLTQFVVCRGRVGADSDSNVSSSGSDSEDDRNSEGGEGGGINFLEYVGLQKSLRRATEQKMELADQLKTAREALRKVELTLARTTNNNRQQLALLQAAQRAQLEEKDRLLGSLKLSLEEFEEAHADNAALKTEAARQMADMLNTLSAEKRDLFVKAGEQELRAAAAAAELEDTRALCDAQVAALTAELAELRAAIDPVKLDSALNRQAEGGASSAEAEALRAEVASLRDRLEIITAQSEVPARRLGQWGGGGGRLTDD